MPGIVLAGQIVKPSQLSATISNLATASFNNTLTETVVGSMTIPASSVNQGYEYHVEGTNDNTTGSPNVTFRIRLGTAGTTADALLATYGLITCQASGQTNLPWSMYGWLRVITGGATGTGNINGFLLAAITGSGVMSAGPIALIASANWTGNLFLSITAQWSSANSLNATRTTGGSLAALN